MALPRMVFFLGLLLFLEMHFALTMSSSDCPLDLSRSNFTIAASLCSSKEDRGKCCRYINALVAVSIAQHANVTGNVGVSSESSEICLHSISETLALYGVTRNASVFCGFGTKIPFNYECQGRTTVNQMLRSPKFANVAENCKVPLGAKDKCRKCLNSGILYLRNLIGATNNTTLSICRDATFAALASQVDNASMIDIAVCFFGVQGLLIPPDLVPNIPNTFVCNYFSVGNDDFPFALQMLVSRSSPSLPPPQVPPSPSVAAGPNQLFLNSPLKENHHPYHLTLVPGIGIAVSVMALTILAVLIILIRRKSRELEDSDTVDKTLSKTFHHSTRKLHEGPSRAFRKFSYKETKKATNNFNTVIGEGGFGTVYKAEFDGGFMAAVKRMNKVSEQAEDEFCKEIELLARLHHRHLVTLKGFCIKKQQRFLIYEYMANGSLKDQLHRSDATPLSWGTRIQIAVDVANALEYLHFYCDPPLCHRDIKSSNILLDDNFVAKVADFGLARASKDGSICFEPVNTDICGTPGYMDPEYAVTRELSEKSDIYSYGVVLLELVTGRLAIQDNKNLVEWSQVYMTSESMIAELVDPNISECFDFDQLQTAVSIIRWCTEKEAKTRPSIKQVLRLLYECADPVDSGFIETVENEMYEDIEGRGRIRRSKMHRGDGIYDSGDGRCLASSSSTSRSHCSRSFLLETGSPQSPSQFTIHLSPKT